MVDGPSIAWVKNFTTQKIKTMKLKKGLTAFIPGIAMLFSACSEEEVALTSNAIAVPDVAFEARLIDLGLDSDSTINQQISIADAEKATRLELGPSDQFEDITDLAGIEGFKNLTFLSVYHQDLEEINLSSNSKLDSLYVTANNLIHLDVSGNSNLVVINASSNVMTSIEGLDQAKGLKTLDLSFNDFEHITIINESLEQVFLGNNLLKTIELNGAPNLRNAMLTTNQLTEVDFSSNTLVETLLLSDNQLTSIDLTQNKELAYLYISSNSLQSLDVSQNQKLVDLRPNRNPDLSCIKISPEQEIPATWLDDYQKLNQACEL